MMSARFPIAAIVVFVLSCILVFAGCGKTDEDNGGTAPQMGSSSAPPLKKAHLLVELPDYCNTPDGMALLPDNSFVLSVPNYNDTNSPGVIMRITPDNKVSKFFNPPAHPDTGLAAPMGICVAPSGDLYYADNQFGPDTPQKSRVYRIEMQDGLPQKAVVVASGLNVANAVAIKGDYLYVSDTVLVPGSSPLVSGVMRFKIGQEGVEIGTPPEKDPHVITTITSNNPDIGYGADGLCFDSKGNLYCGNFADGTIHKITFDSNGDVASNTIWINDPKMKCADGLCCDTKTDRILVADMVQNAIQMINPDGTFYTLAMNGDTDGADGGIDQPCEAIFRGDEVIISNMDWPFPGVVNTTWDKPYTLSVVKLK